MNMLIEAARQWLTATGPPNWLFLVALLTSPWTWSTVVTKRLKPVLERALPSPEKRE